MPISAGELYASDRETPPYSGFPGAFDAYGMLQLDRVYRYFLAVVKGDAIVKILRTPIFDRSNEKAVEALWREKSGKVFREYKRPEYDILLGTGTIRTFIDSLEEPYKWRDAVVEELE